MQGIDRLRGNFLRGYNLLDSKFNSKGCVFHPFWYGKSSDIEEAWLMWRERLAISGKGT